MFDIEQELKKIPQKSGVYLMKDENQQIIYRKSYQFKKSCQTIFSK